MKFCTEAGDNITKKDKKFPFLFKVFKVSEKYGAANSQNKYFYKIRPIKKEKNIKEDTEHRYRYKEFKVKEKKLRKICTSPV